MEIITMQHDSNRLGYMPTLDGVRGLACILVIIEHMDLLLGINMTESPIGSLGVMLFFSLSGFLMGALYFSSNCSYDEMSKYAVSRFSRIVPAYYIAIVFCWVLYLLIPEFNYEMTPMNLVRAFAFMGSEGVFWSIPPEVQFYGFFLLLWLSYAQFTQGNRIWMLLMVIATGFFVATRDLWGGILLPSKLHVFLFGVGASLLLKKIYDRNVKIPAWLQIALCISSIIYYVTFANSEEMYNSLLFAALIGATVMSLSAETKFTSVFKVPVMRFIGAASFSIYLFHEAIMWVIAHYAHAGDYTFLLQLFLMLVIGLGMPILFHIYVERRLNRQSKTLGLDIALRFKQRYLAA